MRNEDKVDYPRSGIGFRYVMQLKYNAVYAYQYHLENQFAVDHVQRYGQEVRRKGMGGHISRLLQSGKCSRAP